MAAVKKSEVIPRHITSLSNLADAKVDNSDAL